MALGHVVDASLLLPLHASLGFLVLRLSLTTPSSASPPFFVSLGSLQQPRVGRKQGLLEQQISSAQLSQP